MRTRTTLTDYSGITHLGLWNLHTNDMEPLCDPRIETGYGNYVDEADCSACLTVVEKKRVHGRS